MDIIYGVKKPVKQSNFPVVTLGVFDGVHKGHMSVINKTISWAREKKGSSIVLTFSKSPKVVLGKRPSSIITSLEHRLNIFDKSGVDITIVMEFDDDTANISADDFIKNILHGWLGVKGVVLGCNCSFGKNREGDKSLIYKFSKVYGYDVFCCEPVIIDGQVVSSTLIRETVMKGSLKHAETMLGRPVSLFGTIVTGSKRGSKVLFPTANLDLHHEVIPPHGVYGALVFLEGKEYYAVTNIGTRPTFEEEPFTDTGTLETVVEVHILNFKGYIYGLNLEVQFLFKIREEKKFNNTSELKKQIEHDMETFFSRLKSLNL